MGQFAAGAGSLYGVVRGLPAGRRFGLGRGVAEGPWAPRRPVALRVAGRRCGGRWVSPAPVAVWSWQQGPGVRYRRRRRGSGCRRRCGGLCRPSRWAASRDHRPPGSASGVVLPAFCRRGPGRPARRQRGGHRHRSCGSSCGCEAGRRVPRSGRRVRWQAAGAPGARRCPRVTGSGPVARAYRGRWSFGRSHRYTCPLVWNSPDRNSFSRVDPTVAAFGHPRCTWCRRGVVSGAVTNRGEEQPWPSSPCLTC